MTEKVFINDVEEDELLIMRNAARAVDKSKMLLLVVCLLTSVTCSEGGFFQQNLGLGIQNPSVHKVQFLPKYSQSVSYAVKDVPEKDESYSISYEDYQFLKRHKVEGQDSPYNADLTELGPSVANHHGKHKRDHAKQAVPCSDIVLKRSVGTNSINVYNNPLVNVPVEPVVKKHVYFHVPPPDFEDAPEAPRVVQPPNKHLNIVLIQAPYYNANNAHLQHLYQKQQAPIEDKTLIYVLSKKQEPPQPVVLPPKPSSVPEVFFVKYKTGLKV